MSEPRPVSGQTAVGDGTDIRTITKAVRKLAEEMDKLALRVSELERRIPPTA